jgi:hypothetical protein
VYPLSVQENAIAVRPADLIARICLTWVVIVALLIGLVIGGAPGAWLELLGVREVGEDLIRACRDIGFMQVALSMGGFFVLWAGPRRQLPILATLTLATVGLSFNLWTMDWAGSGESVWRGLAIGSLVHVFLLVVVISRWWSYLRLVEISVAAESVDDQLEDELTEAETVLVRLGTDEEMPEDGWEKKDAPWVG